MQDDEVALVTTAVAHAAGISNAALRRSLRAGELVRLRRGVYAVSTEVAALSPVGRHRLLVRAARLVASDEPVFCGESAAALLGIPLLTPWSDTVHTTVGFGGRPSGGPVARAHRSLEPADVTRLPDGTSSTSPARTTIELAASFGVLQGIVAMSHLRSTGTPVADIADALGRTGPIEGVRRARLALPRSVDGSESALETLVMVRCDDLGFARPTQQQQVVGVDGNHYRVDFAWLDGRILAEADGRVKYVDPSMRGGRSADDVLWDEKQREDALRPGRDAFVRLTWDDAWNGAGLERRLSAAGVPRTARRAPTLTQ